MVRFSGCECSEGLTRRQRQVLDLIAARRSVEQMAFLLGISFKTVRAHKNRLSKKLTMLPERFAACSECPNRFQDRKRFGAGKRPAVTTLGEKEG